MEIDHKHTYKFCMNHFHLFTNKNMATVRNFEVISNKFKIESVTKLLTY